MSELKTRTQRKTRKNIRKAKKKRSVMRTLNWMICAFLFLYILVFGINIGTIISTLVSILALPIESIQNLWKTLFKGKSLSLVKGLILLAMFVFACTLMPDSETDVPNSSEIASEENIDVEQNKEELDIIINDENEVADAEQEVEQQIEQEAASDQNMTPEKEDSSSSVVFDSESFSPSNSTNNDSTNTLPNKDVASNDSSNTSSNNNSSNDSSNTTSNNTTSNNTTSNDSTSNDTSSNNTTSNNTSSDTSSGNQENSSSGVTVPTPDTGENLVWVPVNGGTKYHSYSSCSNMKDPIQVTVEKAIANGYEACKRCH